MSRTPPRTLPWVYFCAGALVALCLFALGGLSFWVFTHSQDARDASPSLALYDEAWDIIQRDFFGEVPAEDIRTYGAIRGSIATIGDPFTLFVEPQPAKREQEELQGKFGGIGATLTLQQDGKVRLEPMIDRPAARAGVQTGDILIAIDGQLLLEPVLLDEVANRLRGPVASTVRLSILRGSDRLDVTITREEIELQSVSWKTIDEAPEIGLVRIERFSALTAKEVGQALDELSDLGASGMIILDLRGNPGGLLDAAVDVASYFVAEGPILYERGADGSEHTYNANGRTHYQSKVIIIVDGGTASAAEIVAGALRDRLAARIVGQTTYGKGSVQRIHRLSDGSSLHVTFARWYTPNNMLIDKKGLVPDVNISPDQQSTGGGDPMIAAAIQLLVQTPTPPPP